MNLFHKKRLLDSQEGAKALLACARVPMKANDVSKLSVCAEEAKLQFARDLYKGGDCCLRSKAHGPKHCPRIKRI